MNSLLLFILLAVSLFLIVEAAKQTPLNRSEADSPHWRYFYRHFAGPILDALYAIVTFPFTVTYSLFFGAMDYLRVNNPTSLILFGMNIFLYVGLPLLALVIFCMCCFSAFFWARYYSDPEYKTYVNWETRPNPRGVGMMHHNPGWKFSWFKEGLSGGTPHPTNRRVAMYPVYNHYNGYRGTYG
jgi:hypothetical protein